MPKTQGETITFSYNRSDIIGYYGSECNIPVMQDDFNKYVLKNYGVSDPYELNDVREILENWLQSEFNITEIIDSEDY